uniref:Membrane protein insertase YidC n=1 Tax=candidate division CPR3 bacterium TaxID=2268181 RepID=A0A7C5YX79_UNCC3
MWNTLFYRPIVNLIFFIYKNFGENLGISIIVIVLILRLILLPLTILQTKSMKKIQKLQPKLRQFQTKSPKDMTMEEASILKDMGIGCAGGCLPTMIQLPFLIAIYQAIRQIAISFSSLKEIMYSNLLNFPEGYMLNTHFLGLDLAKTPSTIGFYTNEIIPYILMCFLVGFTQWLSGKILSSFTPKVQKEVKKKGDSQDINKALSSQTQVFFPLITVSFALMTPAALGIYWIAQSIIGIILTLLVNYSGHIFSIFKKIRQTKGVRPNLKIEEKISDKRKDNRKN